MAAGSVAEWRQRAEEAEAQLAELDESTRLLEAELEKEISTVRVFRILLLHVACCMLMMMLAVVVAL